MSGNQTPGNGHFPGVTIFNPVEIIEWTSNHIRWQELRAVIEQEKQTTWLDFTAEWHLSSHILVAERDGAIVGFLRFTVQAIGAEDDLPDILPISSEGRLYTEAKILAFGVPEVYRRQGIGRALQEAAIRFAYDLGCWQIRSFSDTGYDANYQVKLSLGYAVHVLNSERRQGVYFLLPLRLPE